MRSTNRDEDVSSSETDSETSYSIDESNTRSVSVRRRKFGVVESSSRYPSDYDDERAATSGCEINKRARRRRKETLEENQNMMSIPGKDRKHSRDKRDRSKNRYEPEKTKQSKENDKNKQAKDSNRQSLLGKEGQTFEKIEPIANNNNNNEKDDGSAINEEDDKNVTFCMWGHENCRTRSHYRQV